MEMSTITDAFNRVVKKQKLTDSRFQEVIEQVSNEISQTLETILSQNEPVGPADLKSVMVDLKHKLDALSPVRQLESSQEELSLNLTKYSKVLKKSLNPNISKAYKNVEFDFRIVNHIIAVHFYRQGLFDLGDCLVNETGLMNTAELRSQFLKLHQILESMRVKNLDPALDWAYANREELRRNNSDIEIKLHRLRYSEILKKGSRTDCLAYARTHLSQFTSLYMVEIQKLMASLLWIGKLDTSPYADLVSPSHWDRVTEELTLVFCNQMGQSYQSPLTVAVAAGIEGLPTLLKLANVMAVKRQEWLEMKHLPVPIELPNEFHFHSLFVCPVSRDQSSKENPPMLLPCSHVLCKKSIMKLSKNSSSVFKCPYCPKQTSITACMQLYF